MVQAVETLVKFFEKIQKLKFKKWADAVKNQEQREKQLLKTINNLCK